MTTNLNRDWATDQQGTYESDLIEREISTLIASVDVIERQVAELINANKILVTPEMLKAAQIKSELGQIVCFKYSGAYILYLNRYGFDIAKIIYEDHSELSITEIYDLRDSIGFILRKECNTDKKYLIWKAIEPVKETEQQKAIRELEESIKASTEKLQVLKRTL